jgi:ABC-type multidrug transport system ATPase subunit/pSer/pThr/pTyr-binding forkhead associated (FHA) protein
MTSTLTLLYRQGKGSWQRREIKEGEMIVGRSHDCDLQIEDEKISRRHFKLNRRGNDVWITDLGSTNGTKVSGEKISANVEIALPFGQFVESGSVVFHVQAAPDTPIEPATASEEFSVPSTQDQVAREGLEMSNFKLLFRRSNEPWMEVQLPLGEFVIGRYAEADLYIEGETISRRHARFTVGLDAVFIQDLGSTNGTQIDGLPLPPRRQSIVHPDQMITIGNHTFQIQPSQVIDRHPATVLGEFGEILTPEDKLQVYGSRFDLRALDFDQLERVSIGRSGDNDVVLDHPLVSRYHALIEKMGTRFRLRDLESTNGVFVNGVRIQKESWLTDGDTITVGGADFVLSGSNLQRQAELGLKLDAHNINQYVSKDLNLLKDISLSIKPMEFVALVGMSGAGKTTFLNAISGYWPASDGHVQINSVNLYEYYDFFRNDIGYVPQKDIVHAELTPATALDYVARLRLPADTTRVERNALIDEVLENLDLTERRDVPISNLSGGQLKRVSIGVELLTKPRLFFLDEPTSGLDPGTEYEMMKLLRRLADQGRTVMLVTHATKNVMLCDKVIFLARGGYLSFFGPPEKALEYFDQYRTTREQREKAMEFDDIYIVLNDENRGSPEEWGQRYLQSEVHRQLAMEQQADRMAYEVSQAQPPPSKKAKTRVSSLRQFMILSARNLKILTQDRVSLALMLALAPAIGLMDFIWGNDLFDPVVGDATKIVTMWFMAALITVLVGAISSVREIVKENEIYKRERAVNLKIAPYVFSKVWVGVVLALYQAGMLLFFKFIFVQPDVPSSASYLALYVTLFIGTLCGYFIGLAISAAAPNQNAAMMLIIIVLVPQFLFAGALLPLDLIPGGEAISVFMPTRWAFESFIRISGLGDQLAEDSCWALDEDERGNLTSEMKVGCPCMGASIFTDCADFPGILSTDYYDEAAQAALAAPKPEEPAMPTPHPSLTPLPTPTRMPSPTPHPTPADPRAMGEYMDLQQEQGEQYQDAIMEQMEVYRQDSEDQGQIYSDIRSAQGDEYQEMMRTYGDERSDWQENREKAISSAEGILETIYDNYGRAFSGSVSMRWLVTVGLMFGFLGVVLIFQKRKDVI